MTDAIVVDLDTPGWLGPWLKRVHEDPVAVDFEHAPWAQGGGGRGRFLALLEAQVQSIRGVWATSDLADAGDVVRSAAVLAAMRGDFGSAETLWDEAERRDLGMTPSPVVAEVRNVGRKLLRHFSDDDHGVVDAGLTTMVHLIDTRCCVTLAQGWLTHPMETERHALAYKLVAEADRDREFCLRVLAALAAADGVLAPQEVALLTHLAKASGVELVAVQALLKRAKQDDLSLDDAPERLLDPSLRGHLIRLLQVMSLIDGEASVRELALIDRLALVFELDPAEVVRSQVLTTRDLEAIVSLGDGLVHDGLLDRMRRRSERQLRSLVRRHAGAIAQEVRETGDLLRLLLESTRRTLTPDEQRRMMEQLRDLGRAVPALALFAAPGGSLLLPLLAKVLPFSLTPSSFEDEGL